MGLGHLSGIELTDYLDGGLSPARATRAERHLAACDRCRQALADLRQAARAMEVVAPVAVPSDLRERVLAKLAAEPAPGLARRPFGGLACREAGPLLHGYVDGELSPALVTSVQRHVRVCVRCRAELVVLTRVVGLLRSLRALKPPAAIRETVWAARRALPAPLAAPSLWHARLRPALAFAAVAAALLLVALVKPASRPTQVAMKPPVVSSPSEMTAEVTPSPSSADTAAEPGASGDTGVTTSETPVETTPASSGGAAGRSAAESASAPEVTVAVLHGPSPHPVTVLPSRGGEYRTRTSPATPSVPSAVLTLKQIASAAVGDSGAHRGMAAAGEPFATLDWEARLAAPPQAKPAASGRRDEAPAPEGTSSDRPAGAGVPSRTGDDRADAPHGFGPWV